ncbi:hypothetical protein DL96DRAFT_1721824 [Flagelloscypha sp. PMI_526]|nr:hypothetical protein DL96DRAFT_1721824 [Flagelloscypha sp. PMI_526]
MRETREGGLKVLTIDGEADIRVGVVSCLFVLLDMMRRAAQDRPELTSGESKMDSSIPEALPYKCFDLIVGSGDGGWIAIMLGRLQMSTSQVIETYLHIRSSVHNSYPHRGSTSQWNPELQATFFNNFVKMTIMNNTRSRNPDEALLTQDPACYVVALAMYREDDTPHAVLFRNYLGRTSNLPNCPIWFAIKAATASSLFLPAVVDGVKFLAASELGFNNPVDEAISEALERARYLKILGPPISCLVSLGAGHPGVRPIDESDRAATAVRLAQDALKSHNKASQRFAEVEYLSQARYFRMNVEQGFQRDLLQGINEGIIHTHTEMYLRKLEVDQSMENIVGLIAGTMAPQIVGTKESKNKYVTVTMGGTSSSGGFPIQHSISKSDLIRTYTKELYTLDFGLPLWDPEPVRKVVEVGDLGFVNKNGSFETLFNITVCAEDQPGYDLPPDFRPFKVPKQTVNIKKNALNDRYLYSGAMELRVVEETQQHWKLSCQIDHGAVLILKDSPTHSFIHPSTLLVQYIQAHYKEWYAFMETLLTCPKQILDCSGLLLVTGMHRNSAWSLGAWKNTGSGHYLSHTARKYGQNHTTDICGWQPADAHGVREGPLAQDQLVPEHGTLNQTLFIEGYRIRRRGHLESLLSQDGQVETISPPRGWWESAMDTLGYGGQGNGEKLADPPGYPSSPPPSTTRPTGGGKNNLLQEINLTPIYNGHFPRHPLDDLADEIFEVGNDLACNVLSLSQKKLLPNAQTVIVHDQDLQKIKHLAGKDQNLPSHLNRNLGQSAECVFFTFPAPDPDLLDTDASLQTDQASLVRGESLLMPSDYLTLNWRSAGSSESPTKGFRGGLSQGSCNVFRQELSDMRAALGDDHPDTLAHMNNLALTYLHLGQYQEARELYEQALKLCRQILGDEHPDTLTSMNNLALTYLHLGQYQDAQELHEQALKLRRQILGGEHPDTLTSMNNLALTYPYLGRYQDARELHEQVLKLSRQILGGEHPDTLTSMNNLALTYSHLGQHQDAREFHEQALKLRKQTLGGEHPKTLTSMNNLALTCSHLGQYQDARELHERALKLSRQILGDEHPDTLTSMNNLALTYSHLGQYQDARELHEQALKLRRQILGDEHPKTLTSMNNLALTYSHLGQYQDARELHEQALKLSRQILGGEHPNTLASMNNLALTYSYLGRYQDARELYEQALMPRRQIFGDKHTDTLASMNNLALTYSHLGRYQDARELHERALKLCMQILGGEHPNTLTSMDNVALTYHDLGQYQDALKLSETVLEISRRVLGDDHPDTKSRLSQMESLTTTIRRKSTVLEPHGKRDMSKGFFGITETKSSGQLSIGTVSYPKEVDVPYHAT